MNALLTLALVTWASAVVPILAGVTAALIGRVR